MTLTLHALAPKKGSRTKAFRIGRGLGSGRGKTSGRGTKGQRSRTGGRNKLKLKGMKQMLLGFPKLRGFHSRYQKSTEVKVGTLEKLTNSVITLETLKRARMAPRSARNAKIVAGGDKLTKAVCIQGIPVSAGAKKTIEDAGGKIE